MVRSDLASSGVIFSIDTESGFDRTVFITGSWGLGENIVQGNVNPDEVHPSFLNLLHFRFSSFRDGMISCCSFVLSNPFFFLFLFYVGLVYIISILIDSSSTYTSQLYTSQVVAQSSAANWGQNNFA